MKDFIFYFLFGIFIEELNAIPTDSKSNPEEFGEYFQGDIRFSPSNTRNGLINTFFRWPNGVIPYIFAPDFEADKRTIVRAAMDALESGTDNCISFIERTSQSDYVEFIDTFNSCWSYVGRIRGKQQINYSQRCIEIFGTVQHELLHAIGFLHQQSSSDRDDYVTIRFENIIPGTESNFDKYSNTVVTSFGEEYDYGSVLHYSAFAFSRNGKKTIETIDPDAKIGQRVGASETDLIRVKKMYGCPV